MDDSASDPSLFLRLADKGRNSWWRYLITIVLAILVQTIVIAIVAVALNAKGLAPDKLVSSVMNPRHPVLFYANVALSFGGLLLGFIVGGAWLHRKSFADYVGRWRASAFALGFGVWLLVLLIDVAVDYGLRPGSFHISGAAFNPWIALLISLSLAVQTFAEEFIFRGYVTQGLLKIIRRPLPTGIISGLIFGALHIPNGWPQAASATVFGVGLALLAIRTGGLAFGYGMHLINNAFGAVVVVAGGDVFAGSPGLVMQNGPDMIAVDLAVVAVALIVIISAAYRRPPARPTVEMASH